MCCVFRQRASRDFVDRWTHQCSARVKRGDAVHGRVVALSCDIADEVRLNLDVRIDLQGKGRSRRGDFFLTKEDSPY